MTIAPKTIGASGLDEKDIYIGSFYDKARKVIAEQTVEPDRTWQIERLEKEVELLHEVVRQLAGELYDNVGRNRLNRKIEVKDGEVQEVQ